MGVDICCCWGMGYKLLFVVRRDKSKNVPVWGRAVSGGCKALYTGCKEVHCKRSNAERKREEERAMVLLGVVRH